MVLVVMPAKVEPKLLGAADEKQQVSNDMNMELPILPHRLTMVNNRPKMSQFQLFPPSLSRGTYAICSLNTLANGINCFISRPPSYVQQIGF